MSQNKIFQFSLIVFIAGIAVASFMPGFILEKSLFLFALSFLLLILVILFKENKQAFIILFFMFCFVFPFFRYSLSLPDVGSDKIWFYNKSSVEFEGRIVAEPDKRDKSQKLTVADIFLLKESDKEAKKNVKGQVLVSVEPFTKYEFGDQVRLKCNLVEAEEFNGFRYDRYLARFQIFSLCYYPRIEIFDNSDKLGIRERIYRSIFQFKNVVRSKIEQGLGTSEAGLVKAIILGDKRGITDSAREDFSRAGLSHIVAISGMHISILSALAMSFFLGLGLSRKTCFYLSALFLISYIIFIGLPASAMRAGLMGFLVMWALYLGRLNKLGNSLLLTAVILLSINPRLLRDDIGFQLSFLAVLGIALVYPKADKWLYTHGVPRLFAVRDILLITISAQVFTLPIIAYNFGTISLVAPLANLAVLWVLPILMITIFVSLALSFIFPGFSTLWFLPIHFLLAYVVKVAEFSCKLPGAYFEINNISIFVLLIYYALLAFFFLRLRKKKSLKN